MNIYDSYLPMKVIGVVVIVMPAGATGTGP
jgi:hypothetical protein